MCGRFSQFHSWEEVHAFLNIFGPPRNLPARYNIAPTQDAAIARHGREGRSLDFLRWGLVPSWAKDSSMAARMINARAETVAQKPSFRDAFKQRRCLVPADGFYEWRGPKGAKQPYRILSPDQGLFAFAGLWERWDKGGAEPIESFTIITTEANSKLAAVHARMPVILDPADFERWLSPDLAVNDALALLRPAPDEALEFHAVGKHVNNARNDDPACITPLPEDGEDDL
ncbi:MAG: SOS response-associated peptidase [Rhodospirillaceae bacterium]|nr:SOS response-associated peptidase [Rhodospirillaceae bacterium]MBT5675733.1 SOS response-associated peptidase [Rhodospirillaceae bacterium]